jgi:hypothetical protein
MVHFPLDSQDIYIYIYMGLGLGPGLGFIYMQFYIQVFWQTIIICEHGFFSQFRDIAIFAIIHKRN